MNDNTFYESQFKKKEDLLKQLKTLCKNMPIASLPHEVEHLEHTFK